MYFVFLIPEIHPCPSSICSFIQQYCRQAAESKAPCSVGVRSVRYETNCFLPSYAGTQQLSTNWLQSQQLSLCCFWCSGLQFTKAAAHPCNEITGSLMQNNTTGGHKLTAEVGSKFQKLDSEVSRFVVPCLRFQSAPGSLAPMQTQ